MLLLAGCASEGPLRPPSLNLPGLVRGFSAERAGNTVTLRWTTPTRTMDGLPLTVKHGAPALTAEICREEMLSAKVCGSIALLPVSSGMDAAYSDTLPSSLTVGDLRPLHYRIRILNRLGRGAEYTTADTLAGAAPPPVYGLGAFPVTSGVVLRWQPNSTNLSTLIRVERGGQPASSADARTSEPHKTDLLEVDASSRDAGGAVDRGARRGTAQAYTVVHTRAIDFNGRKLTISSAPATVTLPAAAIAPPPPPPHGLEAIANTMGAPEIDLVWQISSDAAAYTVYRAEGTGTLIILTPVPVQALSYTDTSVRPGVRYRYSVSSVDGQGAEGRHGPEITATVPQS